jgi:pyruvate/2-oxoglutarate dehydrogenase complex dihydrolipoamide acyltransferase (E2) component
MSDPASYTIEPRDRALEAAHAAITTEVRPGNTVTFLVDVDMTEVERVRAASGGRAPSYTAFVVKAVAMALRDFPYANRRVHRVRFPRPGPRLQTFTRCDVAVAAGPDVTGSDTESVVKVVRDADRLATAELDDALDEPVEKPGRGSPTRRPWFNPRLWVEKRGGAALVSTPGEDVADAVVGTWSYPLGVSIGRVEPRAGVRDGGIVARPSCTLALNFDRRVMAGAPAAWFFRRVVERLERAETELAAAATPDPAPAPVLER